MSGRVPSQEKLKKKNQWENYNVYIIVKVFILKASFYYEIIIDDFRTRKQIS